MLDRTAAPVADLARSLSRLRSGEGTNAEVIHWLRAVSGTACAVPLPNASDTRRTYSRTLLHRCEQFEILVLHWPAGSVSSIHDHGGSLCWLAVAQGSIGVENFVRRDSGSAPGFARIDFDGREMLAQGAVDYRQDDVHLHRCIAGEEPAVSLHVYARPIDRFYTFDERAQSCSEALSTYDAILSV